MTDKDIARFEANVQPIPETGCWVWTAASVEGYGVLRVAGRQYRAHRLANRQNILENSAGLAAQNARKTHCPKGHPYNAAGRNGRGCTECKPFPYHETPEYRRASRERIRAVRAQRTAAGLTTRGTPRKYKGYDKTQFSNGGALGGISGRDRTMLGTL